MATSTDQRYEYVIQGTVLDRVTRAGIQGVKVEAWDRDTRYHDMLGVSTTDANGRFTIGFQTAYFGDYAPDRAPDIFFKAFIGEREMLTTFDTPMTNVDRGTTTVTLELQLPTIKNKGVDRIDGLHALKALDWWGQSDFRGVYEQGKDKSKSIGRLLGAMGEKSLTKLNIKPVRPAATTDSQIVNQSALQAEKNLLAQNIEVTEVKQASASSRSNLMNLKDYPLALKAGDRVTLYEENGVVKYYTRTPRTKSAGVDAEKVANIDSDMQTMKAQMRDIDSMRAEMEKLKETTTAAGQMLGDGSKGIQAQAEELSKLRTELAAMRKSTAEKDAQIVKLRTDLDMVRTAQANQTTNIPMSRLEALEAEIVRLRVRPGRVVGPDAIVERGAAAPAATAPAATKRASTKAPSAPAAKPAAKKAAKKVAKAPAKAAAKAPAGKRAASPANEAAAAPKPRAKKAAPVAASPASPRKGAGTDKGRKG